jgi:protoheme IX farnesyltransferase
MSTDGHELVVPVITDPTATARSARATVAAYFALTKPRIIELLLITTVPSMILAAGRWPGTWAVVATLIGGSLSAGGANALNNYVDRDIDQVMRRTRSRPLAKQVVAPANALVFGVVLGVAGFVWLAATTNLLAAGISTAALLFYVFVYTIRLKRTSTQNIVIGGAAGAAPALVGWAAVTGSLALPAWVLFLIVFYWTPPHFWALAIRYRDDYERAGVPPGSWLGSACSWSRWRGCAGSTWRRRSVSDPGSFGTPGASTGAPRTP